MKKFTEAKNMRESIIDSAKLFKAIVNGEIGKDQAREALRAGDQIIGKCVTQMTYDENRKKHRGKKIKFLED